MERGPKRPQPVGQAARFAQAPYFAQQQPQVISCAFQSVGFADVDQTAQPTPSSSASLAHVGETALGAFTAPPIQPPTFRAAHPPSIGSKCRFIFRRLVGPASILL